MKKIISLLLAAVMLLSVLAGCGGNNNDNSGITGEQTNKNGFQPVSKTLGEYDVKVIAFEHFNDGADDPCVRIYYEFTNNSDESISPFSALTFTLTQDGQELDFAAAKWGEEAPEDSIEMSSVRPGVTVRSAGQYTYVPEGGDITVSINEFWSEETLEFTVTPDQFNGRPAKDFTFKTISDPQWTVDLPNEGVHCDDYYVTIGDAELYEEDGQTLFRVFFEFTNNSDEEISPWIACTLDVYQDGVELETNLLGETAEDEAYSENVAPGETVIAAACFVLRSDSPVEVEFVDIWNETAIGTLFELD